MSVHDGPFDTYTAAPRIDTELTSTRTTYGEPYTNTLTWTNYKIKTITTTYRYKILFVTASAAAAGITAITAALGADKCSVRAVRAYEIDAYDIEVDFCEAVHTEILATGT